MITRQQIKFLQSLQQKKIRRETGLFLAEGAKIVPELLHSGLTVKEVYAVQSFVEKYHQQLAFTDVSVVNETELQRISGMTTANEVVAVVEIPERQPDYARFTSSLCLYLDNIRDPGNMGTIIRTADWFGISDVICSPECVELWNPKTVQSTMASLGRVNVYTIEAHAFFTEMKKADSSAEFYGTFLEGKSIYQTKFPKNGVVVIGNESNGISAETERHITQKITIPSFASQQSSGSAESLNAAVATAITIAEIRRQQSF